MSDDRHDPSDVDDPDDLEAFTSPLHRLATTGRTWIAAVLAVALIAPGLAWVGNELAFRRSADAVVATLDGELTGEAAAEAVVLVRTNACSGHRSGSGTAFVLETSTGPVLLTNRHVVEDAAQIGLRRLDGSSGAEVTDVELSSSADVAVLEVADPDGLPPALEVADEDVEAGETVRLVGFPAAEPFTTAGEVAEVGSDRLLLDLEVTGGASGSPVITEDGRVVGQVYASTSDGLGVATPTAQVLTAVEETEPKPIC